MPDTPDYLARIRDLAAARDPLTAQAQSPALIAELIANIPAERLITGPAPGKWSVAEILAHLAEDEIATAWRYRQIVEHLASPSPASTRTSGQTWATTPPAIRMIRSRFTACSAKPTCTSSAHSAPSSGTLSEFTPNEAA
jgi:hypothetical protein